MLIFSLLHKIRHIPGNSGLIKSLSSKIKEDSSCYQLDCWLFTEAECKVYWDAYEIPTLYYKNFQQWFYTEKWLWINSIVKFQIYFLSNSCRINLPTLQEKMHFLLLTSLQTESHSCVLLSLLLSWSGVLVKTLLLKWQRKNFNTCRKKSLKGLEHKKQLMHILGLL